MSGSSLTAGQVETANTGELVLAGANSYRGTTTAAQGILTVANSLALGATGGPEAQTVALSGSSIGTFTLTFDGHTTDPVLHPLAISGLLTGLFVMYVTGLLVSL